MYHNSICTVTPLHGCTIVTPLHGCTLLHGCTPLHSCTVYISLHSNTTAWLHHCTVAPLHSCTMYHYTLPLHGCTIVQLHHVPLHIAIAREGPELATYAHIRMSVRCYIGLASETTSCGRELEIMMVLSRERIRDHATKNVFGSFNGDAFVQMLSNFTIH